MAAKNESRFETAFTVSIEAREGVTTGISAADRARTIQVAIDPDARPADLVQPGHVFPLKSKPGGVLERAGQTGGRVDLARLAGLIPAGVICEIMNDDGTMARVPDLVTYCARHNLKMVTVADLIAYRRVHDVLVSRVVETSLPTRALASLRSSATRRRRMARHSWPWSRGMSMAHPTCSCGCTRNASPATSSLCVATAASSSRRACAASTRPGKGR